MENLSVLYSRRFVLETDHLSAEIIRRSYNALLARFHRPPKLQARIAGILNILTVVVSEKKLSLYGPLVTVLIDAHKLFHKFLESQEVVGPSPGRQCDERCRFSVLDAVGVNMGFRPAFTYTSSQVTARLPRSNEAARGCLLSSECARTVTSMGEEGVNSE